MKRTPLKRKTPLKTKTPLRSKSPLKSGGTGLKRGYIKHKVDAGKAEADGLWQELIRLLWGKRCAMCGTYLGDHRGAGHHLVTRRVLVLRYDPDNGMLLCDGCHNSEESAPHKSPKKFLVWLEDKYPSIFEWLETNRHRTGSKPNYREVCSRLREQIEKAR